MFQNCTVNGRGTRCCAGLPPRREQRLPSVALETKASTLLVSTVQWILLTYLVIWMCKLLSATFLVYRWTYDKIVPRQNVKTWQLCLPKRVKVSIVFSVKYVTFLKGITATKTLIYCISIKLNLYWPFKTIHYVLKN